MKNKNQNLLNYLRYILAFLIFGYFFFLLSNAFTKMDLQTNLQIQLLPQEVFSFYTPASDKKIVTIYLIDFFLFICAILILVKKRLVDIIALFFGLGAIASIFWRNWLSCRIQSLIEWDAISVSICLVTESL